MRVSVHVSEELPGTRSRGTATTLSMFVYRAEPILPLDGARLKTSVWRRIPDYAIPSRAKVNGAYVNSVLAKQDAIDAGYDDCIFLDASGHVCELSAANIFIVRGGVLITPSTASDLLEGINRDTVLQIAARLGIETCEREVDLTELYIADEVFACGTSTYVAPVKEVDARMVNGSRVGRRHGEDPGAVPGRAPRRGRGRRAVHHATHLTSRRWVLTKASGPCRGGTIADGSRGRDGCTASGGGSFESEGVKHERLSRVRRREPRRARFCMSCGARGRPSTPGPEERKVVTVLFCDLTGSTAWASTSIRKRAPAPEPLLRTRAG